MIKIMIGTDNVLYVKRFDGTYKCALEIAKNLDTFKSVYIWNFEYEEGASEEGVGALNIGYKTKYMNTLNFGRDDVLMLYYKDISQIELYSFDGDIFDVYIDKKIEGSGIEVFKDE